MQIKLLIMKTMTVGEFKTHFSEVIEEVKKGEVIALLMASKKIL